MFKSIKPATTALIGLIVLIFIWSYSWLVTKSVLSYISAFDFTALRNISAGLLLLIILKIRDGRLVLPPILPTILIGVFQTTLYGLISQVAMISGGAGKTAILAFTMPFWTVLLANLLLAEKLNRLQYIALTLAGIGLMLILQPWHSSGTLLSSVLAVIAGLFWAISNVLTKKAYAKHTIDPLALTAWQILFGSVPLFIIALVVNQHYWIPDSYLIFAFFYSIVIVTAFGWLLWSFILKRLSAGIAGMSILAIPVLSLGFSWWLMAERLNVEEVSGALLIITALLLLHVKTVKKA